jgi:hypothetical protein
LPANCDALQILANGLIADILFTDIVMPGAALRPDLKVLFILGYALETLGERGRLPADTAGARQALEQGPAGAPPARGHGRSAVGRRISRRRIEPRSEGPRCRHLTYVKAAEHCAPTLR